MVDNRPDADDSAGCRRKPRGSVCDILPQLTNSIKTYSLVVAMRQSRATGGAQYLRCHQKNSRMVSRPFESVLTCASDFERRPSRNSNIVLAYNPKWLQQLTATTAKVAPLAVIAHRSMANNQGEVTR